MSSIEQTKDIVFGRTVVPVPLSNKPMKKDKLGSYLFTLVLLCRLKFYTGRF